MDRTCDVKRFRQHPQHSPSLGTTGEAETRAAQEHLASNCRRGAEDPPSQQGNRSEAGPEQTGVGLTLVCVCHTIASRHNGPD